MMFAKEEVGDGNVVGEGDGWVAYVAVGRGLFID